MGLGRGDRVRGIALEVRDAGLIRSEPLQIGVKIVGAILAVAYFTSRLA